MIFNNESVETIHSVFMAVFASKGLHLSYLFGIICESPQPFLEYFDLCLCFVYLRHFLGAFPYLGSGR